MGVSSREMMSRGQGGLWWRISLRSGGAGAVRFPSLISSDIDTFAAPSVCFLCSLSHNSQLPHPYNPPSASRRLRRPECKKVRLPPTSFSKVHSLLLPSDYHRTLNPHLSHAKSTIPSRRYGWEGKCVRTDHFSSTLARPVPSSPRRRQ